MRTGKLNKRVSVKSFTLVSDGAGGTTETPVLLRETWAKVTQVKGQRLFQLNQIFQGTWYDIEMRFREDFTKDLKIDYNGKSITIHTVIEKDDWVLQVTGYTND